MKTRLLTSFVLLLFGFALLLTGCGKPAGTGPKYHCPMHPTVVSDQKGTCPICSMDLVPIKDSSAATSASQAAGPQYQCPLHPNFVRAEPGTCDICGTELVKTSPDSTQSNVKGRTTIAIAPETRQRMGLTLGTVAKRQLVREIRTSARIVPDETRLHHVTLKLDGWVEHLHATATGQRVEKGEPLLTIYSPELLAAQREFVSAVQASSAPLIAAARRRLELWDITDEQITRLQETGKPERAVTLLAPASGWIMERNISAGHRAMAGEVLMTLADLSVVWAEADLYPADLPHVQVGTALELNVPAVPHKTFAGKISFITPTIDPVTRTARARLELPNPDLALKPQMFGTARLRVDLGERLAIPVSAVLFTGTQTIAFRESEQNHLVPVELKLGVRSGEFYEVIAGVQAGDQVVTSANFLVDSESSMKAALELLTGGGGHAGH